MMPYSRWPCGQRCAAIDFYPRKRHAKRKPKVNNALKARTVFCMSSAFCMLNLRIYIFLYIYVCMYVCMHACMHVYIYIHRGFVRVGAVVNMHSATWYLPINIQGTKK